MPEMHIGYTAGTGMTATRGRHIRFAATLCTVFTVLTLAGIGILIMRATGHTDIGTRPLAVATAAAAGLAVLGWLLLRRGVTKSATRNLTGDERP
ncbi:hypothetical protein ACIBCD_26775 [Nocardia brasiliensis]|uniref:hypothetical protein n=1 Tax=Nocardia brasiliensis TaxID=37326 RepID=UPI0037AF6CDA